MDKETLKVKQLSFTIFEKILLDGEYQNKQEILLKAVKLSKEARSKNAPKSFVLAQDEALKMIKNLSFEEIKEIIAILKND